MPDISASSTREPVRPAFSDNFFSSSAHSVFWLFCASPPLVSLSSANLLPPHTSLVIFSALPLVYAFGRLQDDFQNLICKLGICDIFTPTCRSIN